MHTMTYHTADKDTEEDCMDTERAPGCAVLMRKRPLDSVCVRYLLNKKEGE